MAKEFVIIKNRIMENYRQTYIDVLKGIGIIMMIAGHTGLLNVLGIDTYVEGFYMPMFFFASGYFLNTDKYNIKEFIRKKSRTLLIPYVFWGILHLILWIFMFILHFPLESTLSQIVKGVLWDNNRHFPIAGALWFLTCLFIVELMSFLIIKNIKTILAMIIILVILLIGLFGNVFLPLSGDSALVAVFFYIAGYYFRIYLSGWWNKVKNVKSSYKVCILVILNLFYINFIYINGRSNIRTCEYGKYPLLYVLHALLGILIWWIFSYMLDSIKYNTKSNIPGGGIGIIKYIGKNSMLFVCLNQLPIAIFKRFIGESTFFLFVETVLIIITIIMLNKVILKSQVSFIAGK